MEIFAAGFCWNFLTVSTALQPRPELSDVLLSLERIFAVPAYHRRLLRQKVFDKKNQCEACASPCIIHAHIHTLTHAHAHAHMHTRAHTHTHTEDGANLRSRKARPTDFQEVQMTKVWHSIRAGQNHKYTVYIRCFPPGI